MLHTYESKTFVCLLWMYRYCLGDGKWIVRMDKVLDKVTEERWDREVEMAHKEVEMAHKERLVKLWFLIN